MAKVLILCARLASQAIVNLAEPCQVLEMDQVRLWPNLCRNCVRI